MALSLIFFSVLSVQVTRQFAFPKARFSIEQRSLLRSEGDSGAPIWIVEYIDYQCGACRTASQWLKETRERFPKKIYLQVRFHPILAHPYGLKSAIYAECASRQGRFWPFHEILFKKQPKWSHVPPEEIDALFESYAKEAGLNVRNLRACVASPLTKATVFEENQASQSMGVKVTPTFFVNGKMIVGLQAIAEELRKLLPEAAGAGPEKK